VRTLEGEAFEGRLVLLEFPTADVAVNWFDDPEYQSAAQIRRAAPTGRLFLVDGVAGTP
jgi:uncharacterized protein (DUF1330 family)